MNSRTAQRAVRFLIVEAFIKVSDPALRLNDTQAAVVLAEHPTLAEHACRQQGFGRFADKLEQASLPHLVEHLAIDLLAKDYQGAIAGTTTWNNHAQQTMLVRLRIPLAESESKRQDEENLLAERRAGDGLLAERRIRAEQAIQQAITEVNELFK
jgi:hypothetical protein